MPCLSLPRLGYLGLGLAEGDGAAGRTKSLLTLRVAASVPDAQNATAVSSVTTLLISVLAVLVI